MSLDVAQFQLPWEREIEPARPFLLPIEHWSPSSLSMFLRCPYQWQQRYIFGLRERPAEAPVIGSAVHAAVERNMAQKIDSHEDLPAAELLDWYDDEAFPSTIDIEESKASVQVLWDTSADAARARGRLMLGSYRKLVTPRVQPTGVEGMISVDFGLEVPVIGRYDILTAKSTIDLKTGRQKQSKPKETWRIQAAVYGEATGQPVEFHSLSATKSNTVNVVTPLESPEMLVQPNEHEREQMAISIRTISAMANMMMSIYGADTPWPTLGRFHDWACSYCGFRPTCPAWRDVE